MATSATLVENPETQDIILYIRLYLAERRAAKRQKEKTKPRREVEVHYRRNYADILNHNPLGERLQYLWTEELGSLPEKTRDELTKLVLSHPCGVKGFTNRMALVDHYMQTTGKDLETSVRALYSTN